MAEPGADADPLLDIAARVADGDDVDWRAAESASPGHHARVRELRLVATIARLRAGLTPQQPDDDGRVAPAVWGPLVIVERLGHGTFGDVFRARDTRLDRDVALKLLRRTEASGSDIIEEARLMARVRHPNVTAIHGADRIDGRVGLWMEFVDGATLEEELAKRGPFSAEDVRQIGRDVGSALSAVHDAGLLHRDVKPQNVMRAVDGRVLLTDFGTGRLLADAEPDTGQPVVGSPMYVAPEVLNGGPASTASDLYSLGVLLFRLATGTFPVPAGSIAELRAKHAAGERASLRTTRPDLPTALARVIDRALAADPGERPSSASEIVRALAPPDRGTRRAWLVAGAGAAAVAAAAWGLATGSREAPRHDEGVMVTGRQAAGALAISHDGSMLAYIDDATGNLGVRNLVAGTTRLVTSSGSWADSRYVDSATFSRDGRRLAYTWSMWEENEYRLQVRLIDVAQATEQAAIYRHDPDQYLRVSDWSPDGQRLVVQMATPGGNVLALIDMGGRVTPLAPLDWRGANPVFSPDGGRLAFDGPATEGASHRDVFVIETNGSTPQPVVTGPGQDLFAGWSAGGDALLFVSDRAGTFGLWRQNLSDRDPRGQPTLIEPDVRDSPLGATADGRVFYRVALRDQTVVVADVDLATGRLDPPSRLFSGLPHYRRPKWSPDGRLLAAVSSTSVNGPTRPTQRVLSILGPAAGQSRIQPLPFAGLWTYSWSADGRTLLFRARDFQGRIGIFRVDAATGDTRPLLLNHDDVNYVWPHWAFGSNARFYYVRGHETFGATTRDALRERDLVTGQDREVLATAKLTTADGAPAPALRDWAVSPDGTHAAGMEAADEYHAVWVVSLRGGPIRQVFRAADITHNALAWTPDSRALLVNALIAKDAPGRSLVVVPIDAGRTPTLLALGDLRLTNDAPAISPDGRQVAFQAGDPPAFEIRAVRAGR